MGEHWQGLDHVCQVTHVAVELVVYIDGWWSADLVFRQTGAPKRVLPVEHGRDRQMSLSQLLKVKKLTNDMLETAASRMLSVDPF